MARTSPIARIAGGVIFAAALLIASGRVLGKPEAPKPDALASATRSDLMRELRRREAAHAGEKTSANIKMILSADDDAPGALSLFPDEKLLAALRRLQKTIYKADDRKDLFEVTSKEIKNEADSVVALFHSSSVVDNGSGTVTLQTKVFGDRLNLCPDERFREQPTGAFCSGVLISKNLVATAAHCVNEFTVKKTNFVFGYQMRDSRNPVLTIPSSDVFIGKVVRKRVFTENATDWAVVELDRESTHKVVRLQSAARIKAGTEVHVIGFPCGLPMKFADGATVFDDKPPAFFSANLDTFGGNSGSPVFNGNHEVEGLLVRGDKDFVSMKTCNASLVCPDIDADGDDCSHGEDVTRSAEFASMIQ